MFLSHIAAGRDTVQEDDPGASTEEAVFDFREIDAQIIPRYADTITGYASSYGLLSHNYKLSSLNGTVIDIYEGKSVAS